MKNVLKLKFKLPMCGKFRMNKQISEHLRETTDVRWLMK